MSIPIAIRRHLVTAALLGATVVGAVIGTAAPAHAAGPADRVVGLSNESKVLVPDRIADGSRINFVERIGRGNDTPAEQTWQVKPAPRGGGVNIVSEPSTRSGRPVCIDLPSDTKQAGVALVLRTCDGSESQTWRALGTQAAGNHMENKFSKLKMEISGGTVRQNEFPDRNAPQQEKRLQLIDINPKSFGVGE
jgi:ribosomal protein S6E (S10)